MTNADLAKLQSVEQNLHMHTAQRSALQSQLLETENASKELEAAAESYRILGNIMVKTDAQKLRAELQERTSHIKARLAGIERQEKKLQEEMKALQDTILKGG